MLLTNVKLKKKTGCSVIAVLTPESELPTLNFDKKKRGDEVGGGFQFWAKTSLYFM